jgi:hypothetical protein
MKRLSILIPKPISWSEWPLHRNIAQVKLISNELLDMLCTSNTLMEGTIYRAIKPPNVSDACLEASTIMCLAPVEIWWHFDSSMHVGQI